MDAGEAIRGRDGNNPREGIHNGNSEEASGIRWIDSPVAGAIFPGRESGSGYGRKRQEPQRDPGAEGSDRGTSTGDRGAIGRDTFLKKNLEGVHLSWAAVEEARVEASLPVVRATRLLGLSRTSYYRQVRGMKDYKRQGRRSASSEHSALLREVALRRPEAGHRKVRLYAIAWERLEADCEGASRMSCYRQLKFQGLIQPGRPARHFKEVRERRRQMLAIPTSLNQVLQGDFTDYETEDGESHHIGCFTEYLSRFSLVSRVSDTETAVDLIAVTEAAINEILDSGHQLPSRIVLVTDNGPAMKSKTYRNFIAKNTTLIHIRGQKYHPQTIGREERFHGSLKIERLYRTLPRNRAELVAEVESYRRFYNFERLHQSLGYLTPAQVYFKGTAFENSYLSRR
jgi:putative transposase